MRFFRRRPGFGGLALIALAMQLILSIGHTHPVSAVPLWAPASMACRSFLPPSMDKPCPPRHSDEHACPICWTTGIAGSLVLHQPAALVLPSLVGEPIRSKLAFASTRPPGVFAFDARGPPAARG